MFQSQRRVKRNRDARQARRRTMIVATMAPLSIVQITTFCTVGIDATQRSSGRASSMRESGWLAPRFQEPQGLLRSVPELTVDQAATTVDHIVVQTRPATYQQSMLARSPGSGRSCHRHGHRRCTTVASSDARSTTRGSLACCAMNVGLCRAEPALHAAFAQRDARTAAHCESTGVIAVTITLDLA